MVILRLRNSTPATNWTLHFQHTFFTIPLIFSSTFHFSQIIYSDFYETIAITFTTIYDDFYNHYYLLNHCSVNDLIFTWRHYILTLQLRRLLQPLLSTIFTWRRHYILPLQLRRLLQPLLSTNNISRFVTLLLRTTIHS